MRECNRNTIQNYKEIYVKCSLKKCIERDVKGLYKKALNGKIKNFTGLDSTFEEPINSDLILYSSVGGK